MSLLFLDEEPRDLNELLVAELSGESPGEREEAVALRVLTELELGDRRLDAATFLARERILFVPGNGIRGGGVGFEVSQPGRQVREFPPGGGS